MNHLWTFTLVVLAGLIMIPGGQSSAQVKYVDGEGNTHYAQSESMVPEQYRAKTKPVGPLPSVMMPGAQGGAPYTGLYGSYSSGSSRLDREEAQNAQRMQNAAEQNLARKRADEAQRATCNSLSGAARVRPDCLK